MASTSTREFDQPLAQRFELGLGREMGEAADRHGDRVGVASGNGGAQVAGQLFHPQSAQHHVPVAGGQRDDAADAQEVGRDQHIGMQDMAIQNFTVEDELAQQLDLLAQLDAQRIFGGAQRGGGMTGRANATDTAGDMRGFGIVAAAQHGFEEAGRFDHLETAFFQLAVRDLDHNIAVTFDSGYMMYIYPLSHS